MVLIIYKNHKILWCYKLSPFFLAKSIYSFPLCEKESCGIIIPNDPSEEKEK